MTELRGDWMPWSAAMPAALLGTPEGGGTHLGFYTRPGAARAHFSTPVTAGVAFARLVTDLLVAVDRALSEPDDLDVVDVGGGDGTLLRAVLACCPPEVARRVRPVLVEVGPGEEGDDRALYARTDTLPDEVRGLVVAVEWLDTLPVEVAVASPEGPPVRVEVAPDGTERLGGRLPEADLAWLNDWWRPTPRAESGWRRDGAWQEVCTRMGAGAALVVDYGHQARDRPAHGSLTGWRRGRQVTPSPDGATDVTAHVAVDSVAAAGEQVGMTTLVSARLRDLLRERPDAGAPTADRARHDPMGYLSDLSRSGEHAVLSDPRGLGAHRVLLQARIPRGSPVGVDWP